MNLYLTFTLLTSLNTPVPLIPSVKRGSWMCVLNGIWARHCSKHWTYHDQQDRQCPYIRSLNCYKWIRQQINEQGDFMVWYLLWGKSKADLLRVTKWGRDFKLGGYRRPQWRSDSHHVPTWYMSQPTQLLGKTFSCRWT